MPQLDPNTFIYQYTGILLTLITTYTILAYVVLPVLLRLLLIRNLFLTTQNLNIVALVERVITSPRAVASLVIKNRVATFTLFDTVFKFYVRTLNATTTLFSGITASANNVIFSNKCLNQLTHFIDFSNNYLILFLLVDFEIDTTNE